MRDVAKEECGNTTGMWSSSKGRKMKINATIKSKVLCCWSTSKAVALKYAKRENPFFFKYKASGMSKGCSIRFLSV